MSDETKAAKTPFRVLQGSAPSKQARAEEIILKVIFGNDEEIESLLEEWRALAEKRKRHEHLKLVK